MIFIFCTVYTNYVETYIMRLYELVLRLLCLCSGWGK